MNIINNTLLVHNVLIILPRIGDTTIIAGVNGPLEARSQKMAYDRVSVEVTYTPLKGPASKL